MKKIYISLIALLLVALCHSGSAQEKEIQYALDNYQRYYTDGQKVKGADKEKALHELREYYATNAYRLHQLNAYSVEWQECLELLQENGQFKDLAVTEEEYRSKNWLQAPYSEPQGAVGIFLTDAFNRIWKIAEASRKGDISTKKALSDAYLKSILHYGKLELGRPNNGPRFHASCFAIPTAAMNVYFCFMKQMESVEKEKNKESSMQEVCDVLKAVALQSWTQPFRNDETDKNVVQIERFRKHVWWVGGNALAYRPLLPVAVMYQSIPMIDLLADISQKAISMTSQQTFDDAFWIEGFTADGAGWGHGQQCLIWGYPIDGTSSALGLLSSLRGTPWAKKLSRENTNAIMNFLRGGSWYYYKGFTPPCLDRSSAMYNVTPQKIRYLGMVKSFIKDWITSFTPDEQVELKRLKDEADINMINMANYTPGMYSGTRWFFNNDDLVKKNKNYYIIVNMASKRCDGLESASGFADEYNFYTTDGLTLFQKSGDEYRKIIGAWDVTAYPGVTAREGMDKLVPVTNWRGYCSKYNFAAGATNGGENAVAGYIFEKMNASDKNGVNDRGNNAKKNEVIYGVQAYKSYFMFGDYMVALGAGVTNLQPKQEGTIRTTIDQTAHEDVIMAAQGGKQIPVGKGKWSFYVNKKPIWVIQKGKFAYTVLPQYTKNASFMYETKKTDWIKRNLSNKGKKDLPEVADIFHLWIDHGRTPLNETYGYVVYAGDGPPPDELPFEVLQNDTLVQAMRTKNKQVTEVVFYNPQQVLKAEGLELSVSTPCVVLIENTSKGSTLTVTDAEMNKDCNEIIVTYNGKRIPVKMPQGMLCGKPVTLNLK